MGAIKKDTKIPLHFVQQEGDPEMRQISLQIEREPEDYGMRGPSLFSEKVPGFDITFGYLIEFFHKICINFPDTFWKDHIFKKYGKRDFPPFWVMTKANRKIMRKRISQIVPTHEMKQLKDPSTEALKGDEWVDWIVTTSLEAISGLLDPRISKIWIDCRQGIMIYLQASTTGAERLKAQTCLKRAGKEMEKVLTFAKGYGDANYHDDFVSPSSNCRSRSSNYDDWSN